MKVFDDYAQYYDLLYKNKDYRAETNYITRLIKKYFSNAKTILDLGCGTGRYDFLLAKKGYHVIGVDKSKEMLSVAQAKLDSFRKKPDYLDFYHSDIRTLRLNRCFDVVISLFHVISYQTTNADLSAAFTTVKNHLKKGGLFIFDCWYGPAVLTERPAIRVKCIDSNKYQIIRIAEPIMHENDNVVDVNYKIFVSDKINKNIKEIRETHKMRYLFKPELEYFLSANNIEMINCEEWMTAKQPGFTTWNICIIGKYNPV